MKVNDLFKLEGRPYRVLAVENDRILCIELSGIHMPVWFAANIVQQAIQMDSESSQDSACTAYKAQGAALNEGAGQTPVLSAKQLQIAHTRFTLIAPLLSVLMDDTARRAAMERIATDHGISKQTLRRYLCKYLAAGTLESLAPAEREAKQAELTQDQKNMRWALNKYFYTTNKSHLTEAYVHLLKEKYTDSEGHLTEHYPSLKQFRYFEKKHRNTENYLISRNGLKNYQRNDRPLLGEGVQEYAPYIGVGMLDATVCDIYLVNDQGQVVGRPVLVAAADANTSLCMGYALLWEGGTYSVQQLMLNVIADKVELCKRLGIEIEERQWPTNKLPGVIVTDMGPEFVGNTFEQISELGVTLINLPSFRPDLKGPVEKLFDLVQDTYTDVLKGKGVIMPDFQERGAHDYRRDACLTLPEFESIVVRCIVHYNSERVIADYPYTTAMLEAGVKPYACDIWEYKLSEPGTNLIEVNVRELTLTLLPRTTGHYGRYGLQVNHLRYHAEGHKEDYLRGGNCEVAYDPDNVSRVWVRSTDGYYEEFELIDTLYKNQSLQEVDFARQAKKQLVSNEAARSLEAKVQLLRFVEATAASHRAKEDVSLKGIRDRRHSERRKNHKSIGEALIDD